MSESSSRPEPTARPPANVPTPAARRPRPKAKGRAQPLVRTFKDYWVMFRERWYLGLVPGMIVGGLLLFQQMRQPKMYYSYAKLWFESTPLPALGAMGGNAPTINLNTHIEQMRSSSFRARVVSSLTPEESEEIVRDYRKPDLPPSAQPTPSSVIAGGAVDFWASTRTPTIGINASHRHPAAAEIIANRYARCFIEFNNDMAAEKVNVALQQLNEEERKLRLRVEEAEAQLQEYRKAHNALSLIDDKNVIDRRLNSISQELIAAQSARVELDTTLNLVEEYLAGNRDITQVAYIAAYRSVGPLSAEIDALKAQRAVLEKTYLEEWPEMKTNAAEIEAKTALLQKNVGEAVTDLRTRYAEARNREDRLKTEQAKAEKDSSDLAELAVAYHFLEDQADMAKKLHNDVQSTRQKIIVDREFNNVIVNILERAVYGSTSPSDLRNAIVMSAFVGGIFLVGIPIGIGVLDSRLKAAWEIEQFLNQTLLGEIPAIGGVGRKERPHIMARELDHGASEAFRGLFGQLQLNSTVPYPKLIMLTSTLPGEGKSVIANNLAATFASHGKKTLLVDCDFRRPNLHVYYGKDNACGIVRWLNQGAALDGLAEENPDLGILPLKENYFLLRAGGESRRATELFELPGFSRLMNELRQQFDVVVIDTPPIGVFPDSMLLSRLVDEIAYVCRFNAVNRSKIRKCIDRLRTTTAVFSGIVLNALPAGKQSAYYDYYGYGANETKRYKAYYAQRR